VAGPDDDDDEGPELPLDGATCSVHGDRTAFRVCPGCQRNACLACWHPSIARCHACLVRDQLSFPPIPWEDPQRGPIGRWLMTIASALSPETSATGFARDAHTNGVGFGLVTFVPLALVAGVIPYTRTLLFGPSFEIRITHGADENAIALDVAMAALTGLLVATVSFAALALPYVSLSRAYADRGVASAPVRLMSYRGWLVPLQMTLSSLLPWVLPAPATDTAALLTHVLAPMVPIVLLLASMRAVARMGSGAGPIATFAILIVPLSLMFISQAMLAPLAPNAAELEPQTTTQAAR
jgi:hypothetical protein